MDLNWFQHSNLSLIGSYLVDYFCIFSLFISIYAPLPIESYFRLAITMASFSNATGKPTPKTKEEFFYEASKLKSLGNTMSPCYSYQTNSTIAFLLTQKVMHAENFEAWKKDMLIAFDMHNKVGLIDGTTSKPFG